MTPLDSTARQFDAAFGWMEPDRLLCRTCGGAGEVEHRDPMVNPECPACQGDGLARCAYCEVATAVRVVGGEPACGGCPQRAA